MAEAYYNAASGNWSTAANWRGGTNGDGTLPTSADDVYANGKTITIDQNITVNSLRTTAGTTAVAGGGFTVNSTGRTLTINSAIIPGSTICLTVSLSGANSCTINGSALQINGSNTTNSQKVGVYLSGTGTVNITGNAVGGSAVTAQAILNDSNGRINLTGNATGGSGSGSHGVENSIGGTVSISGTSTGGSHSASNGVHNSGTGKALLGPITASSVSAGFASNNNADFMQTTGPLTNSTGVSAVFCTRMSLVSECDWTIAKAGTPPAYNGTVTIGLKSGGGAFTFVG